MISSSFLHFRWIFVSEPNLSVNLDHVVHGERFECNICLDDVREPIVTQCGHLFCWSCLYRWLNTNHQTCPVCKAGVTKDNVIPLFIRGSSKDPKGRMLHGFFSYDLHDLVHSTPK